MLHCSLKARLSDPFVRIPLLSLQSLLNMNELNTIILQDIFTPRDNVASIRKLVILSPTCNFFLFYDVLKDFKLLAVDNKIQIFLCPTNELFST